MVISFGRAVKGQNWIMVIIGFRDFLVIIHSASNLYIVPVVVIDLAYCSTFEFRKTGLKWKCYSESDSCHVNTLSLLFPSLFPQTWISPGFFYNLVVFFLFHPQPSPYMCVWLVFFVYLWYLSRDYHLIFNLILDTSRLQEAFLKRYRTQGST